MTVLNISAEAFLQFDSVILIDVREASEFVCGSVSGAVNYPLSGFDVESMVRELGLNPEEVQVPIGFICRSGRRSLEAARKFRFFGFANVYNLEGGMLSWEQSGLPVREAHGR